MKVRRRKKKRKVHNLLLSWPQVKCYPLFLLYSFLSIIWHAQKEITVWSIQWHILKLCFPSFLFISNSLFLFIYLFFPQTDLSHKHTHSCIYCSLWHFHWWLHLSRSSAYININLSLTIKCWARCLDELNRKVLNSGIHMLSLSTVR